MTKDMAIKIRESQIKGHIWEKRSNVNSNDWKETTITDELTGPMDLYRQVGYCVAEKNKIYKVIKNYEKENYITNGWRFLLESNLKNDCELYIQSHKPWIEKYFEISKVKLDLKEYKNVSLAVIEELFRRVDDASFNDTKGNQLITCNEAKNIIKGIMMGTEKISF